MGPEIITLKRRWAGRTRREKLIANSRKISIARAKPTASAGNPLDLSSNHTCALVADEVGHGNRNRLTSQSGYPSDPASRGTVATASPRRCRATPATVRRDQNDANQNISAYSASENSISCGDVARFDDQKEGRQGDDDRSDPLNDSASSRPLDAGVGQVVGHDQGGHREQRQRLAEDKHQQAAVTKYPAAQEIASYAMATPTNATVGTGRA